MKLQELLETTFPSSIENNFILKPKHCHQKNKENWKKYCWTLYSSVLPEQSMVGMRWL